MRIVILTISLLLLTSCIKENSNPYIVNYTIYEQQELEKILQQKNNPVLNRFIIDYYNLRQSLK